MSYIIRNKTRLFGVVILVLFAYGFTVGAIGQALFGGAEGGEPFLPKPKIHLPAQEIFSDDAQDHLPPSEFVITNTLLSSWITTLVIIFIFLIAVRGMRADRAPRGFANLVEAVIGGMYSFVEGVSGKKNARRFFPFFATIFLFVMLNAWMGLLPFYPSLGFLEQGKMTTHLLRPAGTDMNMPLALALLSFVYVEFWGFRMLRISYLGKFFRFGALLKGRIFEGLVDVFVGVLEMLSEFIRIVSFTFRLFGNMIAGEILLLITVFLIPFVFTLPFYFLELLVGVVQAIIFAGLTLVFVTVAVTPHHREETH